MGALGLEAVLVGNVGHFVGNPIGSYEREFPLNSNGFIFRSGIVNLGLLIVGNPIAGLEPAILYNVIPEELRRWV